MNLNQIPDKCQQSEVILQINISNYIQIGSQIFITRYSLAYLVISYLSVISHPDHYIGYLSVISHPDHLHNKSAYNNIHNNHCCLKYITHKNSSYYWHKYHSGENVIIHQGYQYDVCRFYSCL